MQVSEFFPAALPPPQYSTRTARPISPIETVAVSGGLPAKRNRFSRAGVLRDLEWIFTDEEAVLFDDWFSSNLNNGTKFFLMGLPDAYGGAPKIFRFADAIDRVELVGALDGARWRYAATLEQYGLDATQRDDRLPYNLHLNGKINFLATTPISPVDGDLWFADNKFWMHTNGETKELGSGGGASVITTKGDLIYGSASGEAERLPVGADGKVLKVVSGLPSWEEVTENFVPDYTSSEVGKILGVVDDGEGDGVLDWVEMSGGGSETESLYVVSNEEEFRSALGASLAPNEPRLIVCQSRIEFNDSSPLLCGDGGLITIYAPAGLEFVAGGTPSWFGFYTYSDVRVFGDIHLPKDLDEPALVTFDRINLACRRLVADSVYNGVTIYPGSNVTAEVVVGSVERVLIHNWIDDELSDHEDRISNIEDLYRDQENVYYIYNWDDWVEALGADKTAKTLLLVGDFISLEAPSSNETVSVKGTNHIYSNNNVGIESSFLFNDHKGAIYTGSPPAFMFFYATKVFITKGDASFPGPHIFTRELILDGFASNDDPLSTFPIQYEQIDGTPPMGDFVEYWWYDLKQEPQGEQGEGTTQECWQVFRKIVVPPVSPYFVGMGGTGMEDGNSTAGPVPVFVSGAYTNAQLTVSGFTPKYNNSKSVTVQLQESSDGVTGWTVVGSAVSVPIYRIISAPVRLTITGLSTEGKCYRLQVTDAMGVAAGDTITAQLRFY